MYSKIRTMPYTNSLSECIVELQLLIDKTDYLLAGAGAGLSTATGLAYAGKDFQKECQPWMERYVFTGLYTSSFYLFKAEEER